MTVSSSRRGPRRACGYVWLVTNAIVVPTRAARDRHGFPDVRFVPHPVRSQFGTSPVGGHEHRSLALEGGIRSRCRTWTRSCRPVTGTMAPRRGTFVDRNSRRPLARPDVHEVPPRRGRGPRVLAHSL